MRAREKRREVPSLSLRAGDEFEEELLGLGAHRNLKAAPQIWICSVSAFSFHVRRGNTLN